MPRSDPTPLARRAVQPHARHASDTSHWPCDDLLVLQEKVAELESWRTSTEPESSTRTTAEAAGTSTFRGLEQNQTLFLDIITEFALAVSRVYSAMSELFDRYGIDETELLRIEYRMAGKAQPLKLKTSMQPRNRPERDPGGYQPGQAVGRPAHRRRSRRWLRLYRSRQC